MRIDTIDQLARATQFAKHAHRNHKRKYTGKPYFVHLDEVMRIVKTVSTDEDVLSAALLHDTIEDVGVTRQDIENEFGPRVANLVVELTNVARPEDGNRAARKEIDRKRLAAVSADAQTVKLADIISNTQDIMVNDPKFAKTYVKEQAMLLTVLTKGNKTLWNRAKAIVDNYYQRQPS